MGSGHVGQRLVELGIDEQDRGARVVDDVTDFVGVETEVDRHGNPAVTGDREQRDQEPGAVLGHDRDAFARTDAEGIEPGGERTDVLGDLLPSQLAKALGGLVGFVHDAYTISVDMLSAVEEVDDVEGNLHVRFS
jgi:hypothetical protein